MHAVVAGQQQVVAGGMPARQGLGQHHVELARGHRVAAGLAAVAVAGQVQPHRVHQQEVGLMRMAQRLGIGQQMGVGVVVLPVPAGTGHIELGQGGLAVLQRVEHGAGEQLEHPVVGRDGRRAAGRGEVVEDRAAAALAGLAVAEDAVVQRRAAVQHRGIQRARQAGQLAAQRAPVRATGFVQGLDIAEVVARGVGTQAVDEQQDELVHAPRTSLCQARGSFFTSSVHSAGFSARAAAYCAAGSSFFFTSSGSARWSTRMGRALPRARLSWPASLKMYSRARSPALGRLEYLLSSVV
mmetsp:Transcript_66505/g.156995  ORF Transcript_66505/g.156995 Transcript_66505/m.156995 type:complete len:297 (+) Transcript_66505:1173-2063(+)